MFQQIFAIHLCACAWILTGFMDNGWIDNEINVGLIQTKESGYLSDHEVKTKYVDSIYFVTTTMTTVGYGDFSATNENVIGNAREQLFIGLLQFCGILFFSYISNRVVQIESAIDVNKMVKEHINDLANWLFRVDRALSGFKMPEQIYDTLEETVISSIRFSTFELF